MIEQIKHNKAYRLNVTTIMSLIINIAYSIGNVALGVINHSYWFITMGAYFLVLSIMRMSCMNALRTKSEKTKYIGRLIGILFVFLCIVLIGSIILSDRLDVVKPVHQIIMLTIATYTTLKTTFAIINIIKVRKTGNPIWIALRNISCADAAAAILTMQRSMLVSFGEMETATIKLMNILTGIGVCLIVFSLGIALILNTNRVAKNQI
jgi:hypothetical protein